MKEKKDKRQEQKTTGILKLNADFFSVPAIRPDFIKMTKMKKGSIGIDVYYSLLEKLTASNYFMINYKNDTWFTIFCEDYRFAEDELIPVIEYLSQEGGVFDNVLFNKGYLFSITLLNRFNTANLFKGRAFSAQDILDYVNEIRDVKPVLVLEGSMKTKEEVEEIIPKEIEKESNHSNYTKEAWEYTDENRPKPTGIYVEKDEEFPF